MEIVSIGDNLHEMSNLFSGNVFFFFFLFFPRKQVFDISCKLSPLETICMKCQNLFSGKNKKKHFLSSAAKFTLQLHATH